ncbi:MAG: FAD-binding oxidoreductase [Ectothiorhodospiraceae bacterium]
MAVTACTLPREALGQWRDLLGVDRVLSDAATRQRYGRTTLSHAPSTRAVLRPERADQIPGLLRIARAHGVSLYPISRGRNWGWGEACPVTEGQVVVDLGDLDRILEINAELGYAVVEPGVTQGQLVQALTADAPEWWLESTNAGAQTSIVGNTLERGLGMGDRTASMCGLEVVLPDGEIVRTGFGAFPNSRVTHLAKWGVGPNIEGLFSQSNLGVVTRMGIWLMPRPEGAECCLFSVDDTALPGLVDALRPFRLRGVLPTNVHVFPVPGTDGRRRWLAVGAIYGSAAARSSFRGTLQTVAKGLGNTLFFETPPEDIDGALRELGVLRTSGTEDLFRAGDALCTGEPFSPGPAFLLGYVGGSEVQKPVREPASADPLENDYGFYFLWATCPATGRDVADAVELVTTTIEGAAFRPQLTIQLPNGRAAVLVIRVCFNRKDRQERERARRCYHAVLEATVAAGFPPWRLGVEGMRLLDDDGVDMALPRRLKALMDPTGVLAPGRYVW